MRSRAAACLAVLAAAFAAALATGAGRATGGDEGGASAPPGPWVSLVVLHTNDVHGGLLPRSPDLAGIEAREDVGGAAALASFVARERAAAAASGARVLLLDGGDVWRGTPEGDLTRGDLVVETLSRLRYDAVALGNHELDLGVENAKRLAGAAGFPWLCANVVETATGERPSWLSASVVVDAGGVRVGIVGLSPPDTPKIVAGGDRMGLTFLSETESAKAAAKDLEATADVVIFLTHLGPDRDRAVLDAVPRAALVVGGHSHTRLARPIAAGPGGKSWIVQAGTGCVLAGRVRLRIHRETKEVALDDYDLVPLVPSQVGTDADTTTFLKGRLDAIPELKALSEPVARLAESLDRAGPVPGATSPAGNLVADAMRAASGADVALTNRGGIRVRLPAGTVTRRDLHLLFPFENTLVEIPMTGAELRAAIETSLGGKGLSYLEVSGLEARFRVVGEGAAARSEVTSLSIAGAPADDAKTYRVVTNSFLAGGGDGYSAFRKPGAKDLGILVRDAVEAHLRKAGTLSPDVRARIRPL